MTLGNELHGDNHKRKAAKRAEREGEPPPRMPYPPPDVTLEEAASLREFCEQLDDKACYYASRVNSLDAEEVNYGALETFARNVAERIRTILGQ